MPPPSATCSTASGVRTPASPERKRYRGAVIGAGGIARQSHLPALRDAAALRGRVEVVALVDSAANVPPVDSIPLLGRRSEERRGGKEGRSRSAPLHPMTQTHL